MILVFCTLDHGGLADYAHAQCEAFAHRGHSVLLLAPPAFPFRSSLVQRRSLPNRTRSVEGSRLQQRLASATTILRQLVSLDQAIASTGTRHVLFTTYSEYLAPLWAWRLRRWRRRGVRFAAVVHDPVRDFVVGPRWWHRWSIAEGYSFLDQAFVHAPIELDTVQPMPNLRVSVIPHGPYPFPAGSLSRAQARRQLGIPQSAPLLLCFGRLRTDKNLNLVLKALTSNPTAHLLIAGPEATPGQWQASDYRQLAQALGVDDRCHWQIHFHSPQEVANVFAAADVAVLAYSASFRSASGVLNVVANYLLPVVASAGDSALLSAVQRYRLGVVVPPDDSDALATAFHSILADPPAPDWAGYLASNSWDTNAQLVLAAMGLNSADG